MKPTPEFLKARNDKRLRSIAIVNRVEYKEVYKNSAIVREPERIQCLRLHFEIPIPYSDRYENTFLDVPIDIIYEDYTKSQHGLKVKDEPKLDIFFYLYAYPYARDHVTTFLKAIKKDVEFGFMIRINNNTDKLNDMGWCSHELYGHIGENCYLLSKYTGDQDINSPIKW